VEFWFRNKHNLAPTDPRFLDMTEEEMEVEWWADFYLKNPAKIENEDVEFNVDAERARIEREGEEEEARERAGLPPILPNDFDIEV
jgi:hypothetical protein